MPWHSKTRHGHQGAPAFQFSWLEAGFPLEQRGASLGRMSFCSCRSLSDFEGLMYYGLGGVLALLPLGLLLCVLVCVCGCSCRRQLGGVIFPFHSVGPGDQIQAVMFGSEHLLLCEPSTAPSSL